MRKRQRLGLALGLAVLLVMLLIVWLLLGKRLLEKEREIIILDPAGEEVSVSLEDFLIGVVAAEMPASFHTEALKAQAVAARTYIAARLEPYGYGKHGRALVCCDSACCQAYLDEAARRENWGERYAYYNSRVAQAVADTAGEILLWDDRPADTLFHAACGGRTEDAAAVWGKSLPYLTSVRCGYCGQAPRYTGWVRYSLEEAATLLDTDQAALAQMTVLSYTTSGRIGLVKLGRTISKGTELRQALGLNSTACHWLILGEEIFFLTVGYGHGVGLCQWGADGMGDQGYTYREILSAYYPCTELGELP